MVRTFSVRRARSVHISRKETPVLRLASPSSFTAARNDSVTASQRWRTFPPVFLILFLLFSFIFPFSLSLSLVRFSFRRKIGYAGYRRFSAENRAPRCFARHRGDSREIVTWGCSDASFPSLSSSIISSSPSATSPRITSWQTRHHRRQREYVPCWLACGDIMLI